MEENDERKRPRRRKKSDKPDDGGIVDVQSFTAAQGVQLWKETSKLVASGRDRMRECEEITLGRLKLVPAKHLKRTNQDVDRLVPTLPQRKTLVLNMTNTFASNRATVTRQRPPRGGSTSDMRAEETETALNTLLLDLFPHTRCAGLAVQQANYLVVTLLAEDLWDACPEYEEEIDEIALESLKATDKKTYRKDGDGKYRRPKQEYWRDNEDRGIESDEYGRRSPQKTKAAYDEAREDFLASHPPFSIRVYNAFDFAPIRDAEGLKGAVVRQLMEPSQLLRKGYQSKHLEEAAEGKVLIPVGVDSEIWGTNGKVYLYHFYQWIDGDPCVSYLIGGQETYQLGADGESLEPATINLREKWGFTRLPISDCYGLYLETASLGDRPVPLMDPLGPALVAMEGALGAANILAWRAGNSKYTVQPAPNVPTSAYIERDSGNLKQIDTNQDGDMITVYGPVGTLAPLERSAQSLQVAEMYGNAVREAAPSGAAFGGDGSSSGREASLLRNYMQSANDMIPEGLRLATEEAASYLLEWACCFMRTKDIPVIPIYTSEEADPKDGDDSQDERTVVVRLNEKWIGKNYKVKAEIPPIPNPIMIQQEVSLADGGYGSFEDVQKARGKKNVMRERVKILNDLHWKSERGQAELAAIDAKQRGDMEKARSYKAFLAKQAVALEMDPHGQVVSYGPSAALDPMFSGAKSTGGGPTSAQAALAGTIGAGRGAEMGDLAAVAGQGGIGTPTNAAPGMG